MGKTLKLLLVVFMLGTFLPDVEAQGILGRIKRRVQSTIENKVERAVDRARNRRVEFVKK